jgi:hypothetical protein
VHSLDPRSKKLLSACCEPLEAIAGADKNAGRTKALTKINERILLEVCDILFMPRPDLLV